MKHRNCVTCTCAQCEWVKDEAYRNMPEETLDEKYELHLSFASKADRDWMAQIIKDHLLVLSEKVE